MAGVAGKAAALYVGDTTSPTTPIGNVLSVSLPNKTVNDIDVSDMDSANDIMEFVPGMIDPGEVTVELNYSKANYSQVQALEGVSKYFKITLPAPSGGTTATLTFGKELYLSAFFLTRLSICSFCK